MQLQNKHATSRPYYQTIPQTKLLYVKRTRINTNT